MLFAFTGVSYGCAREDGRYAYAIDIRVTDEAGAPVRDAIVGFSGRLVHTDKAGEASLTGLYGPTVVIVEAGDYIPEPITVDRSDSADSSTVEVQLFARHSSDGARRWTMHVGGDAMFGRRYLAPEQGLPILPAHDIGGAARAVVADLAPSFSLADLTTVNLECVVGDLPDSDIYPAKRFILLSPPQALSALAALSVDVVTLGNNHIRDYLDRGVTETVAALEAVDLPYVGVSDGAELDVNPIFVEPQPGLSMGIFSYTTVNGDFVNDNYPDESEPVPAECAGPAAPDECFLFDTRTWGFEGAGVSIPALSRRVGTAWRIYADLEEEMTSADQIAGWESLYAVYPELQDWTARRGHGGASGWDNDASPLAITAASEQADLVMVQLHAGFQFQTAPSSNVKRLAQISIEAGADIVIAHHPHVLQGAEWYQGKLILYSLGNFIFDQDFLVTFTSAFLRTIWEGETLLEARLIPIELVGYRPVLTTGPAAARTIAMLWESSATPAFTARDNNDDVRRYIGDSLAPGTEVAHMYTRHHDAIIRTGAPPSEDVLVEWEVGETVVPIEFDGLIHAQAGGNEVAIGRELFGWGHLEDALADDVTMPAAQWFFPGDGRYDPVLRLDDNAARGLGWIEMYRDATFGGDTFSRPIARIPVPEHRVYLDDEGDAVPADGEASYTIRIQGKLRGAGQPYLRLEFFFFDDTDPTEDPLTVAIGPPLDLDFELEADNEWHTSSVEVEPGVLWHDDLRANVVLTRVRFRPPSEGESVFAFDDFEFIEWRAASQMPDQFGVYTHLRTPDAGSSLTLEGMALRAP